MAARITKIRQTEETRAKIRTTQLIKRLEGHAFGEVELSSTQVRAIEVLIRKTLPDLATTEITGENGGAIKTEVSVRLFDAGIESVHPASVPPARNAD